MTKAKERVISYIHYPPPEDMDIFDLEWEIVNARLEANTQLWRRAMAKMYLAIERQGIPHKEVHGLGDIHGGMFHMAKLKDGQEVQLIPPIPLPHAEAIR